MKYKLLAADVDGTLYNSQSVLTETTKEAVCRAIDKGVLFVICTGRSLQGVEALNNEINRDLPYITYNGAVIVKGKNKEIIYERYMLFSDAKMVYELGEEYNITMVVWAGNQLYVNKDNEDAQIYSRLTKSSYQLISSIDEVKGDVAKILWSADDEKLIEYEKQFGDKLSDTINYHRSLPGYLEFVDAKVSKGMAIQKICDIYGINISETIAIGDGHNDYSMITTAGLGVAMGNAPDAIKEVANYVTTSCDDEGVTKVINKFILESE